MSSPGLPRTQGRQGGLAGVGGAALESYGCQSPALVHFCHQLCQHIYCPTHTSCTQTCVYVCTYIFILFFCHKFPTYTNLPLLSIEQAGPKKKKKKKKKPKQANLSSLGSSPLCTKDSTAMNNKRKKNGFIYTTLTGSGAGQVTWLRPHHLKFRCCSSRCPSPRPQASKHFAKWQRGQKGGGSERSRSSQSRFFLASLSSCGTLLAHPP